jgi:HKD family nuclease
MDAKLVAQGRVPGGTTLTAALQDTLVGFDFNRLDVAVAYATVSGITALEKALAAFPGTSRWVVGLDDAITQPEAVVRLMEMPGATVRLATLAAQGRRFHPKVYCLWSSVAPERCVLSVGSGNMTLNGLRKNGEVAAILSASSAKESDELKAIWAEMWELGTLATKEKLDEYRVRYKLARKAREAVTAAGAAPPDPEPDEPVNDDVALDGELPRSARCQ